MKKRSIAFRTQDSNSHDNETYSDVEHNKTAKELKDIKFALDQASIVAITDANGIIEYVNDKFVEISGYTREELIGKTHRVINSGYHPKSFFAELWNTIKAGNVWHGEICNKTKQGSYYWVETTIVPLMENDGKPYQFVSIRNDITERIQQEDKLRFMDEAGKVLSSSLDYETTLQNIANLSVPYLCDWCTIDIVDSDQKIHRVAISHSNPEVLKWAIETRDKFEPDTKSPYGVHQVIETGKSVFLPDISQALLDAEVMDPEAYAALKALNLTSAITVPLRARNQVFGAISFVATDSGRHYTEDDLHFVEELGRRAGIAIDNSVLFKSAQQELVERVKFEKALIESEERYRSLAENVPLIIWTADSEGKTNYINNKWGELTGSKGYDWDSRRKYVHPDDIEGAEKAWKKSVKRSLPYSYEYRIKCKSDNTYRWFLAHAIPTRNSDNKIAGWVGSLTDIHDQKSAEHAVREGLKWFQNMADNAPVLIWLAHSNQDRYYFNKVWLDFTGRELDQEVKGGWQESLHPEERESFMQIYRDSFKKQKGFQAEYRLRRHDGIYRWILSRGTPLFNSGKEFTGFVGTSIDITQHKEDEEMLKASLHEKEVLLKEIHHRVKNNLQIITSLLNLQSRKIKDRDALAMFTESQNRVRSMALVHETLYKSTNLAKLNFSEYMRNLATQLFRSYDIAVSRTTLDVDIQDEVFLPIDVAIPCGLIINELLSNSLKYAFPDKRKGTIRISLYQKGSQHVLTVQDDGVGLPEGFDITNLSSLGLMLVQTLTEQLNGKLDIHNHTGVTFTLKFQENNAE